MKVVLQKDVPGLGDAGELKEVADGYARNYLLPRKLVITAYGGTARAIEHQKKISAIKMEKRNKTMAKVAEDIKALGAIELQVKVGSKNRLFGSVTSMDVANALKAKGFEFDKRRVEMGDKIRSLGNHTVKVRLSEKIVVPVTLSIVQDMNFKAPDEEVEALPAAAEENSEETAEAAEAESETEE